MKLFRRSVELVVIRNIFNPQEGMQYFKGHDIESLLKQAFSGGLSENVRIRHGSLTNDVTPRKDNKADVDRLCKLDGRFYAVVQPMGLAPWAVSLIVSIVASVAIAFLMPVPNMGNQGQTPSPNNALAARTNQQRLGGRVPDIFGTVYSVPDLLAVTYSVYIDGREVEYSYMCVGRGKHHVFEAYDDTTPIKYVRGSSVLIYNPDDTLDDAPAFVFGDQFSPSEAEFAQFTAKRYTSVNGQDLAYPESYDTIPIIMRAPNIIETSDTLSLTRRYNVGDTISVEDANDLESGNGITYQVPDGEGGFTNVEFIYNLSGSYEIATVTDDRITLVSPELVNADWQTLSDNADFTVEQDITISQNTETLWQGYHYTEDKDHDGAYINIVALNGIYATNSEGKPYPRKVEGVIESELVDANGNAIAGTLHTQTFFVQSPSEYAGVDSSEENIKRTAATTVKFTNPHFVKGKRMRFRVARTTERLTKKGGQVVQDIKLKDFYSYRVMTDGDYPKGVTTVYSKTLATEGALSLKERKLRLLVQRYVTDATTGILKLSNRVDDIIRHIATDPKIGNLDLSQIDMAQIKSEIDTQIAYFGTDKCAEFCYTFDDTNLSAEETIQTVARAAFCQASRNGNKIILEFERKTVAAKAIFNSHNILPKTFKNPKSYGVIGDYDGVKVEYTDPSDDATVTLSYPSDNLINPHQDKLIGVRNKVQAHIHAMRLLNRDLHTYKSCEFTAGDESNIVVRTNRITAVDQLRADVQQGSVHAIETIGSDIVLHTTDPVAIYDSAPHTLFIQTINNGVESIPVTARDDYSVILARLPSGEISSGYDVVVQATYEIASNANAGRDDYLVTEKSPGEGMTNSITATNYDDRFYQNDTDYINSLIT